MVVSIRSQAPLGTPVNSPSMVSSSYSSLNVSTPKKNAEVDPNPVWISFRGEGQITPLFGKPIVGPVQLQARQPVGLPSLRVLSCLARSGRL